MSGTSLAERQAALVAKLARKAEAEKQRAALRDARAAQRRLARRLKGKRFTANPTVTMSKQAILDALAAVRSKFMAIADPRCDECYGYGVSKSSMSSTCDCVHVAIFRACWRECCRIQEEDAQSQRNVTLIRWGDREGSASMRSFGMPQQEFCADFHLIARRALLVRPRPAALFDLVYRRGMRLLDAGERMGYVGRGVFSAHRSMQKIIGRAFLNNRPYALFPIDEYFAATPKTRTAAIARAAAA